MWYSHYSSSNFLGILHYFKKLTSPSHVDRTPKFFIPTFNLLPTIGLQWYTWCMWSSHYFSCSFFRHLYIFRKISVPLPHWPGPLNSFQQFLIGFQQSDRNETWSMRSSHFAGVFSSSYREMPVSRTAILLGVDTQNNLRRSIAKVNI